MSNPPLSLYVHLPWCVRKCPYCDFNSHAIKGDLPADEYIELLLTDLEQELPLVWGRTVHSVFLGGGTPSLFRADRIERLLNGIRGLVALSPQAEITMEANPGTIEHDSFSAYRDAGINRISLGVQSFSDERLKAIGRIHGRAEILNALGSIRAAGIDNFNIDLMFGLPGQSGEEALEDIRLALEAGPAHLSHYQLTLEPNTAFFANPPELPDDEAAWEMQSRCAELLTDTGYEQYEISAWSLPGSECRHNLNYWLFGDYLAIGAGAHGKISDSRGIFRYVKPANPLQYMGTMEADPYQRDRTLIENDDLVFEFMLNALRLTDGFCERTGRSAGELAEAMQSASNKGLIAREDDAVWRPTSFGKRFLNDLQAEFLVVSP